MSSSSRPASWPSRTPASTSATAPAGSGPAGRQGHQGGRVVRRLPSTTTHRAPVPGSRRRSGRAPESASPRRASRPASQGELGIDGQAGRQREAGRLGDRSQLLEGRPRPLRVDVIGGHRATRRPSRRCRRRAARRSRRRGWVAPARGHPAAGSGGPRRSTTGTRPGSHGSARCIAVTGLGQEVLDDDLLHVARIADGLSAIATRASTRSARLSPMPTRIPVVKGMPSRPADSKVASLRSGILVGRAPMAGQTGVQGLDHHALGGADGAQGGQLIGARGHRRWREAAGRSPR